MLQLNTTAINQLKTEKADLRKMDQELYSLSYDFQGKHAEQNPTQRRKVEVLTREISIGPKSSVEKPVDWYKEAFVKLNEAYHHKDFIEISSYFSKGFQQAQKTVMTEISSLKKAERGAVQINESSSDERKSPEPLQEHGYALKERLQEQKMLEVQAKPDVSNDQSEEKKGPQGPT